MTDLKNNLEEVWKEEFENLFNEKYNKVLCGYTLRQWTTQEKMDQERELALPYYIEARKKSQKDINLSLDALHRESEENEKLEQELQKTREQLCEHRIALKNLLFDETDNSHINAESLLEKYKEQFKDKQGE